MDNTWAFFLNMKNILLNLLTPTQVISVRPNMTWPSFEPDDQDGPNCPDYLNGLAQSDNPNGPGKPDNLVGPIRAKDLG